ncbi:hypothetical protein [Mesorhizobium sp. CN2-181]|uniref:hypothetical protein n=1 Tax=Mesorhizobium yinganensis TaxID=3157707 RepID=UPI0032B814A4
MAAENTKPDRTQLENRHRQNGDAEGAKPDRSHVQTRREAENPTKENIAVLFDVERHDGSGLEHEGLAAEARMSNETKCDGIVSDLAETA